MNFRALRSRLKRGAVIAYPTESCYGLGCDPSNRKAVQKLLGLKRRPQHKGLILIASSMKQLRPYIKPLDQAQQARVAATWPGPHTWLIPASNNCPPWLTGTHPSLACRVTAHPLAALLCRATGMALVSTSANRAGGKPVKTADDCARLFGRQVLVIPGRIGKRSRPSTIQDLASGAILRK